MCTFLLPVLVGFHAANWVHLLSSLNALIPLLCEKRTAIFHCMSAAIRARATFLADDPIPTVVVVVEGCLAAAEWALFKFKFHRCFPF